jgi:hypothetical protein
VGRRASGLRPPRRPVQGSRRGGVPLMPFDPANVRILPPALREPVQPPAVPERGGGDPRRPVHIKIVVHLSPPPRRRRSSLWWWLAALMVLALAAHSHPTEWHSYPFGNGTNYSGTDQQGQQWTVAALNYGRHGQWPRPRTIYALPICRTSSATISRSHRCPLSFLRA